MRILLITPFAAERSALAELLRGDGHHVISAPTRCEGLIEAAANRPDVIIADAQVLGLDGRELVRELAQQLSPSSLILLCPRAQRGCEVEPAVVCLKKPIELAELHRCLTAIPVVRARVA